MGSERSRMIANVDDAEQHGEREEVLQEAERVPVPDERDGELRVEQDAVRLEVHGGQDEEAPHGEEVGDAGDRTTAAVGFARGPR